MEYSTRANKVYYNPQSKQVITALRVDTKTLVFDSVFEFNVYRVLAIRDKLDVTLHAKSVALNWHVDFTVRVKSQAKLPDWICKQSPRFYKNKYLFIDAKGVLDRKVIKRVQGFTPKLQQTVILITPRKIVCPQLKCIVLSLKEIGGDKWLKNNPPIKPLR